MLDMICRIFIALFAIVGVTEICRFALFWLLRPQKKQKLTILISLQGHDEEAEYYLRSTLERLRWLRHSGEKEILCVDCGMDLETRMVCEKFCHNYLCVRLCTFNELPEYLKREFANT